MKNQLLIAILILGAFAFFAAYPGVLITPPGGFFAIHADDVEAGEPVTIWTLVDTGGSSNNYVCWYVGYNDTHVLSKKTCVRADRRMSRAFTVNLPEGTHHLYMTGVYFSEHNHPRLSALTTVPAWQIYKAWEANGGLPDGQPYINADGRTETLDQDSDMLSGDAYFLYDETWVTVGSSVSCPTDYEPVCCLDGNTYANECIATQEYDQIVKYRGRCSLWSDIIYWFKSLLR